jgi:DNA-binding transcriptional LysR family regulator
MQLEALRIYCDVVRFHSFSRGAEENGVLQSSASQAVQNIEENLGVTLIDRSCRPWELTDEGRLFYDGCREVLEKFEDTVARVKGASASGNAVIRVAAIYSVNMRDMTQRVLAFQRQNPEAKVEVDYAHPDRVLERVHHFVSGRAQRADDHSVARTGDGARLHAAASAGQSEEHCGGRFA